METTVIAQMLCICQDLHYSIFIDRNYSVIPSMECSPSVSTWFVSLLPSSLLKPLCLHWVFLNKVPNVFPFRTLHSLSLLYFFFFFSLFSIYHYLIFLFIWFAYLPHQNVSSMRALGHCYIPRMQAVTDIKISVEPTKKNTILPN